MDRPHQRQSNPPFRLGEWLVVPEECRIGRYGGRSAAGQQKVSPRAMEVLVYLAGNPQQVVTVDQLLDALWKDTISSPNAVYKCIAELRAALQDRAADPSILLTIPKRGYKLLVEPMEVAARPAPIESSTNRFRRSVRHWAALLLLIVVPASLMVTAIALYGSSQAPEVALIRGESATIALLVPRPSLVWSPEKEPRLLYQRTLERLSNQHDISITIVSRTYLASTREMVDHVVTFEKLKDSVVVSFSPGIAAVHLHPVSLEHGPDVWLQGPAVETLVWDLLILSNDDHRERLSNWGTNDLHAYRLAYQAALHQKHLDPESLNEADALLRKAIERDPVFLEAYGNLASVYANLAQMAPTSPQREQARQRMLNIVTLARQSGLEDRHVETLERHLRFISATSILDVERTHRQALLADPYDPEALYGYAQVVEGAGLIAEAREYYRAAIARAPPDLAREYRMTARVNLAGITDLEESIRAARELIDVHPNYLVTLYGLVVKNSALGRYREAETFLERLKLADDQGSWAYAAEVELAVRQGRLSSGSPRLVKALADPRMTNLAAGKIYFVVGDVERGVQAWRQLESGLAHLLWRFVPQMQQLFAESVISDPRYRQLLDDIGIGARWQHHLQARMSELAPVTGIVPTTTPDVIRKPSLMARLREIDDYSDT